MGLESRKRFGMRSLGTVAIGLLLAAAIIHSRVRSAEKGGSERSQDSTDVSAAASLKILGPVANAHLGGNGSATDFSPTVRAHAIAIGDFNGDGIPDIVIGDPEATFTATTPGHTGLRTNAGAVYVIYGSKTLSGTIDINSSSPSTGPSLTILGANSGDGLGFSVAVGDVNGDGIPDLIIGAPGFSANGGSRLNTGAAFVILGSGSHGVGTTIDLAVPNTADVEMLGIATGDQFGSSVAVGDVGGPAPLGPVPDIAVGAPGFAGPVGDRPGAGGIFVKYGGASLAKTAAVTDLLDYASANTPPDVEIVGNAAGDGLGTSVALGPIHGTLIGDIVCGAPHAARPSDPTTGVSGLSDTGAVYAVFGGTHLTGLGTAPVIFDFGKGQQSISIFGVGPGDRTGASISVADVTGDNNPDIVIGAPDASGPPAALRANCGDVFVIKGGVGLNPASGFDSVRLDMVTAVNTPTGLQQVSLVVYGSAAGDRLGTTVATGLYNVGTFDTAVSDLFLGAPGYNGNGGAVAVIFGGTTLAVSPFRDFAQQTWDQLFTGSNANGKLGTGWRVRETLATTFNPSTPQLVNLTATVNSTTYSEPSPAPFAGGSPGPSLANVGVVAGNLQIAPNPALHFNGTGTVTVPNSGLLQPSGGGWTVEFWINGRGSGSGSVEPVISSLSGKGWKVGIDHSTGVVHMIMNDSSQGFDMTSNASVDASLQHWAVVFDRTNQQAVFYKNGTVDATRPIPGANMPGPINESTPITIGSDGSSFLNATLDDVRVWDFAVGTPSIVANYGIELTGSEQGLVAYWKFNENTGTQVFDSTPDSNTGTLSGSGVQFTTASQRFLAGGTRISDPGFTSVFNGIGPVTSSNISWNSNLPAGTSLKVETSMDNGTTYQVATNGGPIPSINLGDQLGWAIAAGDINGDGAGDLILGSPFATVNQPTTRVQAGISYALLGNAPVQATPTPSQGLPPTVSLTSPIGGETLLVGHVFDITWIASSPQGDAAIATFQLDLSTDGGKTFNYSITSTLPGSNRNYLWTVPPGFNTTHGRIRVTVIDNQGLNSTSQSGNDFTITDTGVAVTLNSPQGGEKFKFGQIVPVTWSVSASDVSLLAGFDLFLSTDGGVTFPTKIATGANPTQPALGASTSSFTWTVPHTCAGAGRIMVVATSLTGVQTSSASTGTFSIEDYGPSIDITNMQFPRATGKMSFSVTQSSQGGLVLFEQATKVEVSSDAAGTQFFAFTGNPKIKGGGHRLMPKGTLNGQSPNKFFPEGATRVIRFTNPQCGFTVIQVARQKDSLVFVSYP